MNETSACHKYGVDEQKAIFSRQPHNGPPISVYPGTFLYHLLLSLGKQPNGGKEGHSCRKQETA